MVKSKFNAEKLIASVIYAFFIILLFTFIDFIVHSLSAEYAVPSWYYTNKIIYGTILATIILYFAKNYKDAAVKAVLVATVTSILLQIRYYLLGYSIDFVISFLIIHFIILYGVTYLFFKYIIDKWISLQTFICNELLLESKWLENISQKRIAS